VGVGEGIQSIGHRTIWWQTRCPIPRQLQQWHSCSPWNTINVQLPVFLGDQDDNTCLRHWHGMHISWISYIEHSSQFTVLRAVDLSFMGHKYCLPTGLCYLVINVCNFSFTIAYDWFNLAQYGQDSLKLRYKANVLLLKLMCLHL